MRLLQVVREVIWEEAAKRGEACLGGKCLGIPDQASLRSQSSLWITPIESKQIVSGHREPEKVVVKSKEVKSTSNTIV